METADKHTEGATETTATREALKKALREFLDTYAASEKGRWLELKGQALQDSIPLMERILFTLEQAFDKPELSPEEIARTIKECEYKLCTDAHKKIQNRGLIKTPSAEDAASGLTKDQIIARAKKNFTKWSNGFFTELRTILADTYNTQVSTSTSGTRQAVTIDGTAGVNQQILLQLDLDGAFSEKAG